MKKLRLLLLTQIFLELAIGQNNNYPLSGTVSIYDYSPMIIMQRNTNIGGFIQGIQTRLQDGTNNWYFGNADASSWIISKGDWQGIKLLVSENGNVGIGTTSASARLQIHANNTGTQNPVDVYGYRTVDNSGSWKLASISQLNSYGIGVLDIYNSALVSAIHLAADGNSYINPQNNGSLGIGTSNPLFRTHIVNAGLDNSSFLTVLAMDGNTTDESPNNSFNATKPSIGLVFRRDWNSMGTPKALAGIYAWGAYNWAGGLAFTTTPAYANGVQSIRMVITDIGHVGIGTNSPGEFMLNVNGKIRANEVVVNTAGADFVFDKNYKLASLNEVEKYINEYKHLPGIQSAKNMDGEGMNVSEMQTKLLQKIEELTLYIIQQDQKILIQEKTNHQLKNDLNELREQINKLNR